MRFLALVFWAIAGGAWADAPVAALATSRADSFRVVILQRGDCNAGVTALVPVNRAPMPDDAQLNAGVARIAGCPETTSVTHVQGRTWVGSSANAAAALDALTATLPGLTAPQWNTRFNAYETIFAQGVMDPIPANLPAPVRASTERLRDALLSRASAAAIERARAATTRSDIVEASESFRRQVGEGGRVVVDGRQRIASDAYIRPQIAEALAPRLAEIPRAPLWLFRDTFETRPEADWRSSPNERRVAQGAPVSQFATTAPTETEIGLALLRAQLNAGRTGTGTANWEGSSTIATSVLWYIPAEYGGARIIVHHVRKKSCRRERDGFRCLFELWQELRWSEAQERAISDIPESLHRLIVAPVIYINNNAIEVDEFFRLTPDGWRAPEIEARAVQNAETRSELITAGMRISANANQCMARQLSGDPTANSDPNC